jgi:DNA (cytosine-5)-methyltransferase 1
VRILNLYAGIGGNRKLWGNDHDITAVEINEKIAGIYRDNFPGDTVVIADAHQYLLDHYHEYDFIWSSPPCPTHSITRYMQEKKVYPDMSLYEEIILLRQWCKGYYVVENVVPYYTPLIPPNYVIHRHSVWCNFRVHVKEYPKMQTCKKAKEREFLQETLGFNLDRYSGIDKRLLLRNCVLPQMGKDIYGDMLSACNEREGEQVGLFDASYEAVERGR